MKGHEQLIKIRKQGFKPPIVFIDDCVEFQMWNWLDEGYKYVTINTDESDCIEALDLRFLVGLRVSVLSYSKKRSMRLIEALERAGVAEAYTAFDDRVITYSKKHGIRQHCLED